MSLRNFFHAWELGYIASKLLDIEEDETKLAGLYRGRYFYPKWGVILSTELLESLGQGFVLQKDGLRDESSESERRSLWGIGRRAITLRLELIIDTTAEGVTFCPHIKEDGGMTSAPWVCSSHRRFLGTLVERMDVPSFVDSLANGPVVVPWNAMELEGIKTPESMLREFLDNIPPNEKQVAEIVITSSAEWIHSGKFPGEQSFVAPHVQGDLVARWREVFSQYQKLRQD